MFNGEKIKKSIYEASKQILEKGTKFRTPDDPHRSLVRAVEDKIKGKEQNKLMSLRGRL